MLLPLPVRRGAGVGRGIAGFGDRWSAPTHLFREFVGDTSPFGRVPSFSGADDVERVVDVHECRQVFELETFDEGSVGIGKRQELVGHGPEEIASLVIGAGDQPCGSHIGSVVGGQYACCRIDDP